MPCFSVSSSLVPGPSTDAERRLWEACGALERIEKDGERLDRIAALIEESPEDFALAAETLGFDLKAISETAKKVSPIFAATSRDCPPTPSDTGSSRKGRPGKAGKNKAETDEEE